MINNKRQDGFTLIEIMITMAIFVFVIAAASGMFRGVLTQFKQQTRIGETNIEGIVGLEILRSDIEQAGYGLPWVLGTANYDEAVDDPATAHNDTLYNDTGVINDNPPRAIVSGQGAGIGGSDVLVIKASNVAVNKPAQEWAYVSNTGSANIITVWKDIAGAPITDENLDAGDRVIVLNPMDGTDQKVLVNDGAGVFFTIFAYNTDDPPIPVFPDDFSPVFDTFETYMIYGIDPDTDPIRMPFNRADYYISTANVPSRCAEAAPAGVGTGVLVKAVLDQVNGNFDLDADGTIDELPLLDCVADLQIIFALDTDDNGSPDSFVEVLPATSPTAAQEIREQLKEVRVYILTHEGQRDTTYTFNNFTDPDGTCGTCIMVGDPILGLGRDFDLATIANYLDYRWKVYSMILKPYNLE